MAEDASEKHHCTGCQKELPEGRDLPEGWSYARVEKFGRENKVVFYLYACPKCTINVTQKQTDLFASQEVSA
jgi:hypothetical protein